MALSNDPWTLRADGIDLRVRLTPRDALDGLGMLSDGRSVLKAWVRVAPVDGAANAAVGDLVHGFLRRRLRLPRDAVSVAAGATSRVKTLRIVGEAAALAATLAAAIPTASPGPEERR